MTEADPRTNSELRGDRYLVHQGVLVHVETAKGETRCGTDPDGNEWSVVMPAHYGEVPGTVGADGDPVDVFVGPDPFAATVFVVQLRRAGRRAFDETKAMLGFTDRAAAMATFARAYDRDDIVQGVTEWPIGAWVASLARPEVTAGRMARPLRKAILILRKGEQLGLFSRPKPAQAPSSPWVNVRPFIRAGGVAVKAFQRRRVDAATAQTFEPVARKAPQGYGSYAGEPRKEVRVEPTTYSRGELISRGDHIAATIRAMEGVVSARAWAPATEAFNPMKPVARVYVETENMNGSGRGSGAKFHIDLVTGSVSGVDVLTGARSRDFAVAVKDRVVSFRDQLRAEGKLPPAPAAPAPAAPAPAATTAPAPAAPERVTSTMGELLPENAEILAPRAKSRWTPPDPPQLVRGTKMVSVADVFGRATIDGRVVIDVDPTGWLVMDDGSKMNPIGANIRASTVTVSAAGAAAAAALRE